MARYTIKWLIFHNKITYLNKINKALRSHALFLALFSQHPQKRVSANVSNCHTPPPHFVSQCQHLPNPLPLIADIVCEQPLLLSKPWLSLSWNPEWPVSVGQWWRLTCASIRLQLCPIMGVLIEKFHYF